MESGGTSLLKKGIAALRASTLGRNCCCDERMEVIAIIESKRERITDDPRIVDMNSFSVMRNILR
jgi:hypothetical protein